MTPSEAPSGVVVHLAGEVWSVPGLLSPEACDRWVALGEREGFEAAPISFAGGAVLRPDLRNNGRVIVDSFDEAAALFAITRRYLPARFEGCDLVGLNERLRLYRYGPGQYFAPHIDGAYRRGDGAQSLLTMMVYLNADCEGGTTRFDPRNADAFEVTPETGAALFFRHPILHAGMPVTRGWKYVLRTDVMFSRGSEGLHRRA
ncbi:MAG: 2OG-Fe(II) oxygenase [Myxococcales bacterium]|nr:2OG-Fe(II) oxygenase [Myxococcales bacterium]